MQRYNFNTTKGQVAVEFPDSLKDITLGQWTAYAKLATRDVDVIDRLDMLSAIEGEDEREMELAAIHIERAGIARDRCKSVTDESQWPALQSLSIPDLHALVDILRAMPTPDIPVTRFTHLPALQPDLQKLRDELPGLGMWERRKGKKRVAKLTGEFMLVPVAEVELRARMALDTVQAKMRTTPPKELQDWMDKEGLDATELALRLMETTAGTPEQEADRLRRRRLLDRWGLELEAGEYRNLHLLIAHLCVPAHNPVYDPAMATMRAEAFKSLPMDVVMGIRSFFDKALAMSKLHSQTS